MYVNGIPEIMFKSINDYPLDLRKNLYGILFLSWVNTLFPGFAARLLQLLATIIIP